MHCDASQSLGKVPVDVRELGVHALTIAGHKLYAPKGVAALYVAAEIPRLPPFLRGAGQEVFPFCDIDELRVQIRDSKVNR